MNETAADGGWGLGTAYRCKPVTKLGFETVIWQFEAMGGVRAHISPAGRECGGHFACKSYSVHELKLGLYQYCSFFSYVVPIFQP